MATYEDALSTHGPSTPLAAAMLVNIKLQFLSTTATTSTCLIIQRGIVVSSTSKAVYCETLDILSAEMFIKDEMIANGLTLNRQVEIA